MTEHAGPPRRIPTAPWDDHDPWMARIDTLSDQEVDEVLAGRLPEGTQDLAPLADVTLTLRNAAATEVAPVMGLALRQALADAQVVTARTNSRFRQRLSGMVAVGVGVVAFGAATAANALPAPMQRVVANAGDLVGVPVPTPDDEVKASGDRSGDSSPAADSGNEDVDEQKSGGPDGQTGSPDTTKGGATPADPGEPGDHEPATPAIPPEHSNGGNQNGTGNDKGQSGGNGKADEAPGHNKPPEEP